MNLFVLFTAIPIVSNVFIFICGVYRCYDSELQANEMAEMEEQRATRSLFVQDLLVSTLESVTSARPDELLPSEDQTLLSTASAISDTPGEDEVNNDRLADDLELISLDDAEENKL